MLCGEGQSLPSCLNWLPFLFIRGLINGACADSVTFFPSLSHTESRYTRNSRCPLILLTLPHHQQPLPSIFVPLHSQLFFASAPSVSTRLKHATSRWFRYCCCTLCFGIYLISNLVKIPSHQLACPGIPVQERRQRATDRATCLMAAGGRKQLGESHGTSVSNVWSIRARWKMRLWSKMWPEC